MRTALALLAPLLLGSCLPRLAVMPRYGPVDVDGELGISDSGTVAKGSLSEAGFEEDDGVVGAVVDLKWGSPHLMVSTQSSTHDGDGRLETTLSQDGVTIPAGTAVSSDLDLGLHQALLTFDLVPGDLEVGIGFGVTVVDFDASITDPGSGESVSTDETVPIPVLAARAGTRLGRLGLEGVVSGMAVNSSDVEAAILDLDLSARWHLFGGEDHLNGSIVLGYRTVALEADYEDDDDEVELDATFDGFYLGFQVVF